MIGRTLGNYRIVEQIGMGGMATVFKAYDASTDRYVAVKILPEQFSRDPQFRQRFEREARAIAKLEHLHILPIFAYGEEEGIAYMAMRYLQAGTLTDRIRQGPLPLDEASRLLSQIASALDHAHAHNVLHRDVKPSNVLLDTSGNAFLTDFGIAKMVEANIDLTGGGILGTPAYMSPEQCRGSTELTPASDQYSLGIVLYEMLTGRTPFRAETPIALIHMQLNEALPPPRQLRSNLPEGVERVLLKALAKDPDHRYQNCSAMAAALARAIAADPVDQAATMPDQRALDPTMSVGDATLASVAEAAPGSTSGRARRGWLWAVVVLVVVGLICGLFVMRMIRRSQIRAAQSAAPAIIKNRPQPDAGDLIALAEPAPSTQYVEPCEYSDHGSGLCLFTYAEDEPVIILDDGEDEFDDAAWSPDGEQIVFSAFNDDLDFQNLYTVNADGTELTRLEDDDSYDISPAWSPDGEWLAFHHDGDLALMHPDGSEQTIIWGGEGERCAYYPQWSPDGESLVFAVDVADECDITYPLTQEIWVTTPDGEDAFVVTTSTHEDDACTYDGAAFSPDGEQIAYTDGECQTWLISLDDSVEPIPVEDFPFWWTGVVYPQWGE